MLGKRNGKLFFTVALTTILSVTSILFTDVITNAANTKKIKSISLKIGTKTVTKKTFTLAKGKKANLKVSVSPKKSKKSVTFKSNNKKIATISKKGVIKAKKKGTAKITVAIKGKDKKIKKTWIKIKVTNASGTNTDAPEATDPPASSTPPADTITSPSEPTHQPTDSYTVKTVDVSIPDGSSTIYGKIYMPEQDGNYPAIIMCHGYNGSHADFAGECNYFAQNGYVACAIDFCGGSARSKSSGATTETTIFTEKSNLLATYRYIKNMSNVDSNRIFLFGGSQGGLVTALATEEVADGVKGMILYFPAFNIPDDWRAMHPDINKIPAVIDFWGLKLGKVFATSIHDFDPFEHVGSYSKNVLILYGAKDTIVRRNYIDRAVAAYQHADLIVYPNDGHGFTPATGIKAREEVLQFMKKQ